MEACEVINGTATDNGGAIFLSEATLLTERLLFERNSATSKGGAVYVKKANLNMTATEMILNEAGEGGGALYVAESSVSMERCMRTSTLSDLTVLNPWQPKTCLEYTEMLAAKRRECSKEGTVPLYHYTSPSIAHLVLSGGLRMSTQGQGDGGV